MDEFTFDSSWREHFVLKGLCCFGAGFFVHLHSYIPHVQVGLKICLCKRSLSCISEAEDLTCGAVLFPWEVISRNSLDIILSNDVRKVPGNVRIMTISSTFHSEGTHSNLIAALIKQINLVSAFLESFFNAHRRQWVEIFTMQWHGFWSLNNSPHKSWKKKTIDERDSMFLYNVRLWMSEVQDNTFTVEFERESRDNCYISFSVHGLAINALPSRKRESNKSLPLDLPFRSSPLRRRRRFVFCTRDFRLFTGDLISHSPYQHIIVCIFPQLAYSREKKCSAVRLGSVSSYLPRSFLRECTYPVTLEVYLLSPLVYGRRMVPLNW